MKRISFFLSLIATVASANLSSALYDPCCSEPCPRNYAFYLNVGSGISCSGSADVTAPSPTWNQAIQGYNSSLGNQAIASLAIGCEFMRALDLELSLSARGTFKYRKFQTSLTDGQSYKREFDLDVVPILFNINLLGRNFSCLNWGIGCGRLYPVLGAGVGVSNLFITNFRTTGLAPTGASYPYPSFSSENQYTHRQNFTYTVLLGVEYNCNDVWAISTGYRWFDAGKFKGSRYQRVNTGAAVDVRGNEWKMRFRANEWYVQLKIFI